MLAVISPLITGGVIDNTSRDLIDLRLHCADGQEPLHFRMRGNCLRDIAGCRVAFRNMAAQSGVDELPLPVRDMRRAGQRICAGDMTLSRRVPERNNRKGLCNQLSLEFFVGEAMRVLIESSAVQYEISLPQWDASWEDDNAQRLANMEALRCHIAYNVNHFRGPGIAQMGDMPACEWDNCLNRAEAYMSIYPSIREKYAHEPDGYLSMAYVMERTHFLGTEADADENALPRDEARLSREWQVQDFLEPQHEQAVMKAMHHPLFEEASRMTAEVQRHIINGSDEKVRGEKEITAFLSGYAGLVSHLLATILLASQEVSDTALVTVRMNTICRRLHALTKLCRILPADALADIEIAATRLTERLQAFIKIQN